MDIIRLRECMEKAMGEIGTCRREIEAKGEAKAKAISDYDRKMAVTLATLRNSENYELAGRTFKQPPISIMEKIAKGICADECYKKEVADSHYKACISNLTALQAQLNAMQSLYRFSE